MALVKNLKLNDDVALASHTHTAGQVSYDENESGYASGTVGKELQDLAGDVSDLGQNLMAVTNTKVSTINHDDSIDVDTTTDGVTAPKVSVKISSETGNKLSLKSTGNKGLYVPWPTAADLGLSTAYVPKGNMTIAQSATNLTNGSVGWVYNMSEGGTVADGIEGSITVVAGDNLVIANTGTDDAPVKKWDKLSATINVPEYTGGDGIDVTNHVVSVDLATTGSGASVKAASGLEIDSNDKLRVKVGKGVEIDASSGNEGKLNVKTGDGMTTDSNGVKVDLTMDGSTNVSGLEFAGSIAGSKTLRVKTASGGGLEIDNSGYGLGVKLATDSGLDLGTDGLSVGAGNGISVSGDTVSAKIDTAKGLQFGTGASDGKIQVKLASSNPGLSFATGTGESGGLKVSGANGVTVSGSNVELNRRTSTSGATTTQTSGLGIDSNAVYVNAGNGLEISGNVVGVDLSDTTGKKNIDNNDGTYVSLNRAFSISGTAKLDDSSHNPTIGQILAALGATMSS